MTLLAMWRTELAREVRERIPELRALADRIESLADDDPRLAWTLDDERKDHLDTFLDMYTASEFRRAIEPYLKDEDRALLAAGARIGPDFTTRFLSTPEGRAETAAIVAMALSDGPRDPRAN